MLTDIIVIHDQVKYGFVLISRLALLQFLKKKLNLLALFAVSTILSLIFELIF